jgi:P4 family phage/plasmid primase-like protien
MHKYTNQFIMARLAEPVFNTIQYCVDNNVPCFTFKMDATKKCTIKWRQLAAPSIRHGENGFAVITGDRYTVIDFDSKHDPPQDIYEQLYESCDAVEKTPGGFHFWFLADPTARFKSATAVTWNGIRIPGLDIRGTGGICYCSPAWYMNGQIKMEYTWMKGNLSTATIIPSHIIHNLEMNTNTEHIRKILASLAQYRVDNYDSWIRIGMALKNSGYSCNIWDEWSRKSQRYTAGECQKKWITFSSFSPQPITISTLYYYLKQDNYPLFVSISSHTHSIELMHASNLAIATIFHDMNPYKYMYSPIEGWYMLKENNTWRASGTHDIQHGIPDILNNIHYNCNDIIVENIRQLDMTNEADIIKHKAYSDILRKISSATFLKGVLAFLPGLYSCPGIEMYMNEKRHLFAFKNGVYDLSANLFRPIQYDDYISVTCGYDYREPTEIEKECVLEFLHKIWPNEAVLKYCIAALSKCLTGYNIEQIFHVFTGYGANGKSCLMDLCKIVFGEYYYTFSVSYLTKESDGKDRPLPQLTEARYARMLVTSEPDDRDRFQVSFLKNLTGNEEVSFRGLYAKAPVTYVPQFKIWILTNDMPRLSKYDQAIERRMRCVHFPTRFVYNPTAENEHIRDDTLTKRFREFDGWRYGLLGLLIDAAIEEQWRPLEMPEEVLNFTAEYMMENNPVGSWLRQNYDITGRRDDCIQKTELYNTFLIETENTMSATTFYRDIIKCNIHEKKVRGERFFTGIVRK